MPGQDRQPAEHSRQDRPGPGAAVPVVPDLGDRPDRQDRGQADEALADLEAGVEGVDRQDRQDGHRPEGHVAIESPPGDPVEGGQGQEVAGEAQALRRREGPLQVRAGLDPEDAIGPRQEVRVERRRPVVERGLPLLDRGIVDEEAVDIVLDRPLAVEDRRGDLDVVAAIPRDQREVPARRPDDRPDRISHDEDSPPSTPVAVEPRREDQAQARQPEADRQVHPCQCELARPPERGEDGDLVPEVRDGLEGAVDPAGPEVEPGPGRQGEGQGDAEDHRASGRWRGFGVQVRFRSEVVHQGFLAALSIASRRALNSVPGFHSG